MYQYDPVREQKLRELQERYDRRISGRWQRLAKRWIGTDVATDKNRAVPMKRYFFDNGAASCKLTLWHGTMNYLPEDLSDGDGVGFYQHDTHNPLVRIFTAITLHENNIIFMHIYDWHGTFFEPVDQEFSFETFDAFVEAYEKIRTALLKLGEPQP